MCEATRLVPDHFIAMIKRITGENSPRQRGDRASKPYSYASREGMTGGSVTAGAGRADVKEPSKDKRGVTGKGSSRKTRR
jgi:hypothetical protein